MCDIVQNYKGNKVTSEVTCGAFSAVSKKYKVSVSTVTRHWKIFCSGKETTHKVPGRRRTITDQDIDYIKYRKKMKPSLTSSALHADLMQVSTSNIGPRTVRRALKSYMSEPWTYKKIKPVAAERLTLNNLVYTETYMDLLNRVDPYKLQFMDESGFRLPEVGTPLYGHAPKGQRALEIVRYHSMPNATLHLLAGNVFPPLFYVRVFLIRNTYTGVLNGIPHSKMFTLNNEMSDEKQFDLLL